MATTSHRPAPADVKKILLSDMERASRSLRAQPASDEAIHSARKALKRARTALRLLRKSIGKPLYAESNVQLRDAGRALALLRDLKVMLTMTAKFLKHEKTPACRSFLYELRRKASLGAIDQDRVNEAGSIIDALVRRVQRWRIANIKCEKIERGAGRIYRRGRKAWTAADRRRSDEALHELRKQTKHIGYALKIYARHGVEDLEKLCRRAEAIADSLGDDHDLVLMQQHLRALPVQARRECASLAHTVEHHRKNLQKQALKRSARLYKSARSVLAT